ncbi:putative late blight resistance protein homolog R1C-3 [Coffea eugenioides]|uniref:putative late blight resistance protein homolog R1C-3 n=1 Tax=Coffea eugenioides TaxID=49369 RepID=UPI000F60C017|nr:putative late blight resistance protein homolog R1C-3 [Coffea eugenioides]
METAVGVGVRFILQNVLQLIQDNRKLISSNDTKLDELCSDLDLLKTFMDKYGEEHYDNEVLRKLAGDFRRLAREVEDVLETHIVDKLVYTNKNIFKKAVGVFDHLNNLRNTGKDVLNLSMKMKKAEDDNRGIGIPTWTMEEIKKDNSTSEDNKAGSNQEGDRIIGFDDAADDVLELLGGKELVESKSAVEEQSKCETGQHSESKPPSTSKAELHNASKQLEVVSIHGMVGLGKTTLARKVLNDPRIEYHFFTRIFVSVSQQYDKKKVLLGILRYFDKKTRDQDVSENDLVAEVQEKLTGKYLIVMDDVWDTKVWDDIKDAFPDNSKGSRVLITTRLVSVANCAKTSSEPYPLRLMKPEEAEELLRTKVFKENKCPPEELQLLETKILDKCAGLPLAVVVTAGILKIHAKDAKWWEDVHLGVAQFVGDDQKKIGQNQKNIDDLIRRSYDNLPHMLKACFLYLGVFPEDMEIQVSKLLQLWIAETFILHYETASLERIAERCLEELVDRNLVMVGQRTLSGRIKTCRLHDTLRDFCRKTAKAEELFQVIHGMGAISSSSHRLCCINSHFLQYISDCEKQKQHGEKVRSFLSFGLDETTLDKDLCPISSVFKPFKLVRVLDILSIKLPYKRFPTKLLELVLLKFIAIYCELHTLPSRMSALTNLETLIVHTTFPTLKIEADIWEMTKLRHLHTNTTTCLPKCKKQSSGSENLQTLSTVSPGSLKNEVFGRTKKLRKLGVRGNLGTLVEANGESSLFQSHCKLDSLETLKLHHDTDDGNQRQLVLPQPHKFPRTLTRLSLHNTRLHWEVHMPILGKLRYLEVLKLKDNAFVGKDWRTEEGGFHSLKVLFIGATDLECWLAKATNFPELRYLILKHCRTLIQIPPDFVHMKNLEKINLERTNDKLVSSARRIFSQRSKMLGLQKANETKPIKLIVYPPE